MTDAELLTKIKSGLGITGTYQDATLQVYIDDVKAFMRSAGVLFRLYAMPSPMQNMNVPAPKILFSTKRKTY